MRTTRPAGLTRHPRPTSSGVADLELHAPIPFRSARAAVRSAVEDLGGQGPFLLPSVSSWTPSKNTSIPSWPPVWCLRSRLSCPRQTARRPSASSQARDTGSGAPRRTYSSPRPRSRDASTRGCSFRLAGRESESRSGPKRVRRLYLRKRRRQMSALPSGSGRGTQLDGTRKDVRRQKGISSVSVASTPSSGGRLPSTTRREMTDLLDPSLGSGSADNSVIGVLRRARKRSRQVL